MTYKEEITQAMHDLSKKKNVVFLGENVLNSRRIYGTLEKVSEKLCIEMPICENLIAGAAIGLALAGFYPICIFQRMDFMLIAADAIINHASLLPKMSGEQFELPIIFRTIKGDLNQKFFVGHQHSKDFTHVFSPYIKTFTIGEGQTKNPVETYENAFRLGEPVLVVEDYKCYNMEIK